MKMDADLINECEEKDQKKDNYSSKRNSLNKNKAKQDESTTKHSKTKSRNK
jgi:hypothetical protein